MPLVTYLFRTTGQVIGVSLSGALLQSVLTSKLRERIHGPDAVSVCPRPLHFTFRARGLTAATSLPPPTVTYPPLVQIIDDIRSVPLRIRSFISVSLTFLRTRRVASDPGTRRPSSPRYRRTCAKRQ